MTAMASRCLTSVLVNASFGAIPVKVISKVELTILGARGNILKFYLCPTTITTQCCASKNASQY